MLTDNMMEIDGLSVKIEGERNLLEVISKTGIKLPVFCYHSDLSIYGACRNGCISGAGQPYISHRHRSKRGEGLYRCDKENPLKLSENNFILKDIYSDIINNRVHELLHVEYTK